jgi:hypothetical protein
LKKILLLSLLAHTVYADVTDIVTISENVDAVGGVVTTANAVTGGLFSIMNHGEVEYGRGSIALTGSMIGLAGTISDDVTTYTIKNEHHNSPLKHINYNYKISWYDSQKINQAVTTYDGYVNDFNGYTGNALDIPQISYKIKGLDTDIGVGYDIIDLGVRDYFSIGPTIGLSFPTLKATTASTSSSSSSDASSLFNSSNTKITTYKVGLQMRVSKSLTSYLSIYASSVYAYQMARLQNSEINLDIYTDGIFNENEIGIRLQALERKYDVTSWFSLSPQLFFTAGVRYSSWELNDVAINLFNYDFPLPQSTFKVESTTMYAGVGYSF